MAGRQKDLSAAQNPFLLFVKSPFRSRHVRGLAALCHGAIFFTVSLCSPVLPLILLQLSFSRFFCTARHDNSAAACNTLSKEQCACPASVPCQCHVSGLQRGAYRPILTAPAICAILIYVLLFFFFFCAKMPLLIRSAASRSADSTTFSGFSSLVWVSQ